MRENALIVLMPSGSEARQDSYHEAYLDCPRPESSICLTTAGRARVGISSGVSEVVILETKANRLVFNAACRKQVPPEVEWLAEQICENLEGHSNRRCAIDFVEWLYDEKPTGITTVLKYFLGSPDSWLIGLVTESVSKERFTAPAVRTGLETHVQWFRLESLDFYPQTSIR